MATSAQGANGYARQADADFRTFEKTQDISVPECHKLLFGKLHLPLDWSFHPSQLVVMPAGRTVLKLIRGAIDQLLQL
jgi:hypothetical protein